MGSSRATSLVVFLGLALGPYPVAAQGPPGGGGAASNLQDRVAALEAAVAALQAAVANEATARQSADAALQADLNGETTTRAAADSALDGRVDKLESGQFDVADLAGTYAGIVLQLELIAPNLGGTGVQHQTAALTFTLNEDFTAVISGSDGFCRLFQKSATGWQVDCPAPDEASEIPGNWFVDAGGSLVVQVGGEDVINDPNFIGAGGRVIISAGTAGSSGGAGGVTGSGHSVFMVLTRMANP